MKSTTLNLLFIIICTLMMVYPHPTKAHLSVTEQTLSNNMPLTFGFENTPFSSQYGEKWLRINFSPAKEYVWQVNQQADHNGLGITNNPMDLTDDRQLWCFVGDASGFKIFNKALGKSLAVTTDAEPSQGSFLSMVDATEAVQWLLDTTYIHDSKHPGYTLIVKNSSGKFAANSYQRNSGQIRCWNAENQGSHWFLSDASLPIVFSSHTPSFSHKENSTIKYAATLNINLPGGAFSRLRITPNEKALQAYFPKGFTKITPKTYRDFTLQNISDKTKTGTTDLSYTPLNSPKHICVNFQYSDTGARYIYYSGDSLGIPTRIPALTQAINGDLWALSDYRFAKHDIGFGDLDIIGRISKDNGNSWSESITLLQHDTTPKNSPDFQPYNTYGDAAIIADRTSNKILLMACAGRKFYTYSTPDDPLRMVRSVGTYNEDSKQWQWSEPEDMTEYMYHTLFKGEIPALFIGAGKLLQSKIIKVGEYYRIYAALCTRNEGNRVVYTDDLGKTWHILGGIQARPALGGDEPKCEELPDGSVILSSRARGHRIINIFTYDTGANAHKNGNGTWGTQAQGILSGDSGTNGEILLVNAIRNSDNTPALVALQSIPTVGRNNVSIFFKEITPADHSPINLADGWTQYQISNTLSAYSTMFLQQDNRIGFLLEENPFDGGYDIVYLPLTLRQITSGEYSLPNKLDK